MNDFLLVSHSLARAGQKPACPTVFSRFLEKGEIGRDFAHNGMAFNKSKSESSAAAEAVSEAVTENAAPAEAPAETPTSSDDEGLSFWRQLFAFLESLASRIAVTSGSTALAADGDEHVFVIKRSQ